MTSKRNILVTSALPYANGPIHMGHLVEYIQTDIWVRFQKLIGNTCLYVCADDTHGTPIMLSAKRQGISPEELIASMSEAHQADFKAFCIEFDHYGSTHTDSNRSLSETFFTKAQEKGHIAERSIEQLYCPKDTMFLPDRFVRGTCPKCQAENQYGDSCEVCSSTYSPTDLIEPACGECGSTPILKESVHLFFKLGDFETQLASWIKEGQPGNTAGAPVILELQQKLKEWFEDGLRDWDISRDAPYFGFEIPGYPDKYFYVWLDAPVGYIAATQDLFQNKSASETTFDWADIWKASDSNWEIHHFIGKDILYFHALFWPAMLEAADYRKPTKINTHGFLTINKEKMSKSRGTFVLAKRYLEHLPPEYLRYYYAAHLTGSPVDLDLNMEDFVHRVNADIVNKVINIGSRLGKIMEKKLSLDLSKPDQTGETLLADIRAKAETIQTLYETLQFSKAMRLIMDCADLANQYIDQSAPWSLVKTDPDHAREVCTTGLQALYILSIYLSPVLPEICRNIWTFLNAEIPTWSDTQTPLSGAIQPYTHLADRITQETANQIIG